MSGEGDNAAGNNSSDNGEIVNKREGETPATGMSDEERKNMIVKRISSKVLYMLKAELSPDTEMTSSCHGFSCGRTDMFGCGRFAQH